MGRLPALVEKTYFYPLDHRHAGDLEAIHVQARGDGLYPLIRDGDILIIQQASQANLHVGDLGAPTASGTFATQGMIVVPCSMASLAAIARGVGTNLLHRSADVCLKEGRKLVLVPRETPLSAIHLENMLILARLGVTMLSPEPAFYLLPKTIEDVIDYVVERALMAVGVLSRLGTGLSYKPLPRSE